MRALVLSLILFGFSALGAVPALAVTGAQAAQVAAMMAAADRKEWAQARQIAQQTGSQAAIDLYEWRLLSAGMEAGWGQYRDFVSRLPDWPNLTNIRAEGERTMPRGVTLAEIDAFVGSDGIQTGSGAIRRAEALIDLGRTAEADEQIIRAWRELSLTPDEAATFRSRFSGDIRPHHQARADMLLWRGLTSEALAMKPLVSSGWAALIEARVRLRRQANGVDAAIDAVPAELAGDPGLAYERFLWRMRKDIYDGALELLKAQTGSATTLGQPEVWGPRRALLARRLYRQGQHIEAYNLANQNHMTGGSDYADLEWFAGWIALRKMNDPDRAIAHFTRFTAAVETPISLGRGHYWMGRAYEAKGDTAQAREWYQRGAEHQTSFYGQLAAEAIGAPVDPFLTQGPSGNWQQASFAGRSVAEAARLLAMAGDDRRTHWFLTHIASTLSSADDLAGIAHLATELNRDDAAIRIAKNATRKGHLIAGYYYPVTGLAQFNRGVEPALAMAIARQESELNPQAISPAGARGLMQLMPATAKRVAGWVGVGYSKDQLTSDWQYNATLGQTYLARRLSEYEGSVAMAAAAYNAGAGRVDQWIGQYGDPRTGAIDWIDWIETIPFNETRNYVQRVLEGLNIYRNRIAGTPVAFNTRRDALGQ